MPAKPSNSVIDISHYNGTRLRFDKAKADGIIGVIQKATQGASYVDATSRRNREAVLSAGLLFGAYHFGDGSDGTLQAKHSRIYSGHDIKEALGTSVDPILRNC